MPPKRRIPVDNNCVDSKKSKQKFPEAKKLDFSDSAIDEVFRDMFADDNAVDSVVVKLDEASENKGLYEPASRFSPPTLPSTYTAHKKSVILVF